MLNWENLIRLYVPLISWVGLGLWLGRKLPTAMPAYLGKFLFWVGVPLGILIFLRQADLSTGVWIAPIVCWIAVLLGAAGAWLWISTSLVIMKPSQPQHQWRNRLQRAWLAQLRAPLTRLTAPQQLQRKPTQGSFLLSTMLGNTGYLGYPVTLSLVGPQFFGWAVLYDTLGSTLAAYGLGVVLAAYFGGMTEGQQSAKSAKRKIRTRLAASTDSKSCSVELWVRTGSP